MSTQADSFKSIMYALAANAVIAVAKLFAALYTGFIRKKIEAELENCPEVDRVLNMITLQLGNDIMVAVKARMGEFPTAHEMVVAINRCEAGLRGKFPEIRWIFFEPDIDD